MSDFAHMRIRIELESIITERCMMVAANQHRQDQGFAQAYGDDAFAGLIDRLNGLQIELRNA